MRSVCCSAAALVPAVFLAAACAMLGRIDLVRLGVLQGLRLWVEVLLPSLFPFAVLCQLSSAVQVWGRLPQSWQRLFSRITGVCGSGLGIVILGALSGYPIGVQAAAAQVRRGTITVRDGTRLSVICHLAGPAYLLGAVGAGTLGNPVMGLALWIIHLVSAAAAAFVVLRRLPSEASTHLPPADTAVWHTAFPEAIAAAVNAMLQVGGSVVFFSVVLLFLQEGFRLLALPLWLRALLCGVLELSNGVQVLQGMDPGMAFICAAMLCGFGGVCVLSQTAACFAGTGLPLAPCLRAKILQAVFSGFFAAAFTLLRNNTALLILGIVVLGMFFVYFGKKGWKTRKYVIE